MAYWEFAGKNGLQGAPDEVETLPDGRVLTHHNADNPAVLDDETIAYALRTSRPARAAFDTNFPNLDAESQARLTALIEENPRETALPEDPQTFHDNVQSRAIRSIPIHTTGPNGGNLWGGGQ